MKLKLRNKRYAVLIPSKGRPEELRKILTAQEFLNRPSTYVGIEKQESSAYRKIREEFSRIHWVRYTNPWQSGTFARESLRRIATDVGYERYVVTDDNTRYSETSLENLVRASYVYPVQPCIIAGVHGTAEHFDAGRIKNTLETHDGLRFYKKRSAMFWCLPHEFYSQMKYTIDEGCMDDVQVTFAAFDHGITAQMVCMDAPFSKARYKPGGFGGIGERVRKVGIAIQRFAKTHPAYMEKVRVTFPWTQIEKKLEGDDDGTESD
jgi:hypothetical protein